ncbi:MAG: hypothetical protein KAS12_01705 [Candidatus Aenigmarchaeota archaeon]|nr:hypothetical protein [Candidatus Aenigmarchaeota archaeon]
MSSIVCKKRKPAAIAQARIKKLFEVPYEFFKITIPNPANINILIATLRNMSGDDDELVGGEYLLKIDTSSMPNKPPSFEFITPNGIYEPGGRICIHIGEFHSQNYSQTMGIVGFISEIANGMISYKNLTPGIRIVQKSQMTKKIIQEYAKASKLYNLTHHFKLVQSIESSYSRTLVNWSEKNKKLPIEFSQPKPTTDDLIAAKKKIMDGNDIADEILKYAENLNTTVEILMDFIMTKIS